MIIMKWIVFSGGLGNQMFQYAFMLSLKYKGIKVYADTSIYEYTDTHNGFELNKIFNTSEKFKKYSRFVKYFIKYIHRKRPLFLWMSESAPMVYDSSIYGTRKFFLAGNWASELYFRDIEDIVRREFEFKNISDENLKIAQQMQSEQSVALHIRRGDYLQFKNFQVCGTAYYEKAIEHICNSVKSPVFYIFSNDSVWAKEFIKKYPLNYRIITHNSGANSYQDMFLMSQCKHNIIVNSTFSWWGAYLNENKGKIVVSPKQWLRHIDCNANCPRWTIVDTEFPEIE